MEIAGNGEVAMNATVKDVMTTHVVAVRKNASFKDMVASLREHRVSAFPVVDDDDKVVGVVSEADLLAKEALNHGAFGNHGAPGRGSGLLHHGERHREQVKAAGVTAADLMTSPPVVIGPHDPVTQAARLMYTRKVKRLPVVDEAGRLIGVVARCDVLSVYSRPDSDIQREITEKVLLDTLLVDPVRFTVNVRDGQVTIGGTPETSAVGHDIIEEIRHVEGVVSVRDKLVYPADQNWPMIAGSRF
jgi:CBS domain-containing protein